LFRDSGIKSFILGKLPGSVATNSYLCHVLRLLLLLHCSHSADGKGESWDLPAIAEGSRFNGGALGENLRPMEFDPFYSW
jgi:hypothetical protein